MKTTYKGREVEGTPQEVISFIDSLDRKGYYKDYEKKKRKSRTSYHKIYEKKNRKAINKRRKKLYALRHGIK